MLKNSNTKISLPVWFAAMLLISTSKKGVSSAQLCTRYNTRQQTSVERFEDALSKVSSAGITYEKLTGK